MQLADCGELVRKGNQGEEAQRGSAEEADSREAPAEVVGPANAGSTGLARAQVSQVTIQVVSTRLLGSQTLLAHTVGSVFVRLQQSLC